MCTAAIAGIRTWRRRRIPARVGTAALGVALVVTAAVLGTSCSPAHALSVNGNDVPEVEFRKEVARRLGVIERKNPEELEGARGERLEEETRRQVATEMIRARIVRDEAERMGVEATQEEVTARVEEERRERGEEQFEKDLREQGLSEADYRYKVEEQVLVDKLGEGVTGEVTVTGEEAESFYLTNKDLFTRTAMVHAAHILLDTEGQAKMVAEDIKNGADFATLARSLSKDDVTRENGGDLGWVEQGTMDPAFEQAAFALSSGQTSDAVEASDGFHVIKVLERREASTPEFSEVRGEAMKLLESRKREEQFSDWLRTAYANARVQVDAGIGEWDPALGMVVKDDGDR